MGAFWEITNLDIAKALVKINKTFTDSDIKNVLLYLDKDKILEITSSAEKQEKKKNLAEIEIITQIKLHDRLTIKIVPIAIIYKEESIIHYAKTNMSNAEINTALSDGLYINLKGKEKLVEYAAEHDLYYEYLSEIEEMRMPNILYK